MPESIEHSYAALVPGCLLGDRFRLVRELGRGGLAQVWLAEDLQLDNAPVACKLLHENWLYDKQAIADLKREVLLARRLRHPNILGVYTFWETNQHRFIVMEYVAGADLADMLLRQQRPFTLAEILPWLDRIAEALDYAHDEGVLHRDIKPANLVVGDSGRVFVADFGIARTTQEVHTRLTGEMTCGTLLFMSPEQLMGDRLDRRSDIYSLAASVYELLSGHPPFYRGSIITQIQMKPPEPIPHLSTAVNTVLMQALSKTPEQRQETCRSLHEQLAGAATGVVVPCGPSATPWPHATADVETVTLPDGSGMLNRMRLGLLLCEAGALTPPQLEQALIEQERTGERLGEVLVRSGAASPKDIARALSQQLQVPYEDVLDGRVDPGTACLLPQGYCEDRYCLLLRRVPRGMEVAMADPLDLVTLNEIEATYRTTVLPVVATPEAITQAVKRVYDTEHHEETR